VSYKAEYIWIDGAEPTQKLRCKTKIVGKGEQPPVWGFDGSSTNQAEGHASDRVLKPVFICPDPVRGEPHKLVLCEVMNIDMTPHRTNKRAALVEAATKAFAFVFIHPFGDGNGRIHRLLIHHVLAQRGYLPRSLIAPISAVIAGDLARYDAVLEQFSARVLPCVDYRFEKRDADTTLIITNDPDDFHRYPDLTVQCEATFGWLQRAIEEELVREIDFLRRFDELRARMREIVDMPDRKEQLFVKVVLDNKGKLAKRERELFAELDDATITALEAVFAEVMG